MKDENKKYPEGHFVGQWMSIGMVIFSGLGIPLSIATDNPGLIGIGPALGMTIGIAIGSGVEEKYKKRGLIIPKEKKNSRSSIIAGIIAIIGIAVAVVILFMVR